METWHSLWLVRDPDNHSGRYLLQHSQEGRLAHRENAWTSLHCICHGKSPGRVMYVVWLAVRTLPKSTPLNNDHVSLVAVKWKETKTRQCSNWVRWLSNHSCHLKMLLYTNILTLLLYCSNWLKLNFTKNKSRKRSRISVQWKFVFA